MFVASLKRLYEQKRITKTQVHERCAGGKITEEEYMLITGEAYE